MIQAEMIADEVDTFKFTLANDLMVLLQVTVTQD